MDAAALFTRSAAVGRRRSREGSGFTQWWDQRHASARFDVRPVPFAGIDGWRFEQSTGNLRHESGRFFSVEGVRYRTGDGSWHTQPIINQPEVGILGLLVKEFDGVLHCLMQAKFEPGNLNTRQISPTVQATRSNFARVHRGGATPFVEYFRDPERGRVLVDVLQSEQGAWFWQKRNRNIVVQVDEDVPLHDDFRWLSVHELHCLLQVDDLVNMDTRTVLACMPLMPAEPRSGAQPGPFTDALLRSYGDPGAPGAAALHTLDEVRSWLTGERASCTWESRMIPLAAVTGWTRTSEEVADDERRRFRIMGVQVTAEGREVAQWSQPLLGTRGTGLSVFLVRSIGGVAHLLVRARPEPGLMGLVELGPTVQVEPCADLAAALDGVPYAAHACTADRGRTHFDTVLSEEGGRFHHARNRYRIIEVGDDVPLDVAGGFCWLTVAQMTALLRHGNYLNIEARSLLACVHTIW